MKLSASALSIAAAMPARWRRPLGLVAIGLGAWTIVLGIDAPRGLHPHLPAPEMLKGLPSVLELHILAAIAALVIGLALMLGVKGGNVHRVAGWTWVACMMTVAVSSFWLRDHGHFSAIHFLSGWVSIAVPMAVAAARRHDMKRHRAMMTQIFMGGLIVAGAFTFVPGRLMWRLFLG